MQRLTYDEVSLEKNGRMLKNSDPIIIQGGMGVGVSSWPLARAVSKMGQLGVVSGTALDLVLARRLQFGDAEGHMRRALAKFPFPAMTEGILDRYFFEGKRLAQNRVSTFDLRMILLCPEIPSHDKKARSLKVLAKVPFRLPPLFIRHRLSNSSHIFAFKIQCIENRKPGIPKPI